MVSGHLQKGRGDGLFTNQMNPSVARHCGPPGSGGRASVLVVESSFLAPCKHISIVARKCGPPGSGGRVSVLVVESPFLAPCKHISIVARRAPAGGRR